jgi:hypothetical protein
VQGLDVRRTSWHNAITHKCSIQFVHLSRHVSGPNEGRKTFLTHGSTVRHVGARHTHPQGLLRGVMVTAGQHRFFTLEVGFDATILVGSLTTGSVCVEGTSTGNCLSEWSLWRWPRKRVNTTHMHRDKKAYNPEQRIPRECEPFCRGVWYYWSLYLSVHVRILEYRVFQNYIHITTYVSQFQSSMYTTS